MQVLLLMASALNAPVVQGATEGVFHGFSKELRARQQSIAEITEMIHVRDRNAFFFSIHTFLLIFCSSTNTTSTLVKLILFFVSLGCKSSS